MFNKISKLSPVLMLAGILLGFLFGYFLPGVSLALDFLGMIFLGTLKIMIIPVIVAALIVGVNAFGDARKAGRSGMKVLGYFAGTTVAAVIVGLVSALIFSPEPITQGLRSTGAITTGWQTISEVLGNLIPGNLIQAVADGKYLGVVLLAVFLGGVLTTMKTNGRSVISLFKAIHEALLKLVNLLLCVAPIGVFSLVAGAVARNRELLTGTSSSILTYLVMAVVALGIHFLVVQPLFLWILGRRSPVEFYSHLTPAFLTALGTSSSLAAFPVTYSCVQERARIDNRASSMVLPLGAVVNLDGTAIVLVVISIFSLKLFGLPLGFENVALVSLLAVVLSIGAAGIPSATLIAAPVLFGAIGLLPQQAIMVSAILVVSDWLVDRIRALVNLSGDAVGSAVIAESFELKTARKAPVARRSPADRRPSRASRGRSAPTRERQPNRRTDRTGDRRSDRAPAAPRSRSPRNTRTTDSPGSERTPQRVGRSQGPSPFQMKASTTPSLEADSGSSAKSRPVGPPNRTDKPDAPSRRSRPQREPVASNRGRTPVSSEPQRRPGRARTPVRTETKSPERKPVPEAVENKPIHRPESATEGSVKDKDNEFGRLSPTVVARELARVSAQLQVNESDSDRQVSGAPEAADQRNKIETASRSQSHAKEDALAPTIETPVTEGPAAEARPEVAKPQPKPEVEPVSRAIQPPDMDELEETEEAVRSTAKDARPELEPEVTFGRSRRQRGTALKKERAKAAPPAEEAREKPEPKVKVEEPDKPGVPEKPEKPETKGKVESPATPGKQETETPVETGPSKDNSATGGTEENTSFGRVKRKRVRR